MVELGNSRCFFLLCFLHGPLQRFDLRVDRSGDLFRGAPYAFLLRHTNNSFLMNWLSLS